MLYSCILLLRLPKFSQWWISRCGNFFLNILVALYCLNHYVSPGAPKKKKKLLFQSLHPAAEYHAAARAVGGCAIYVRYSHLNCRSYLVLSHALIEAIHSGKLFYLFVCIVISQATTILNFLRSWFCPMDLFSVVNYLPDPPGLSLC